MLNVAEIIKHLEELNSAISEGTIVSRTNTDGVITYANEAFCTLSGYSKEEIIGQKNTLFNSGLMEDSFYKEFWETITSKNTFKGIMKNRSKTGSIYYFSATIKPILNTNLDISEYISIGHDVTDLVKSLEAVKIEKELKNDFFRNMEHEMKTPLNAIFGLIPLIKKRCVEDERTLKMLNAVEESTTALHDLITSINHYKLFENRTQNRIKKSFVLKKSLDPLLEKSAKKAVLKNQKFNVTVGDSTIQPMVGDPDILVKLLDIVLDNAFKFTPHSGHIALSIDFLREKQLLEIRIKDNGIGIDPLDHTKIFQLQQLDGTLNRPFNGIGLGLALAKSIIDFVGGNIEIESTLGSGALFIIEYPINIPLMESNTYE